MSGSGSTDQHADYPGFGGRVGESFTTSEPWWPPRPTAPAGAPNVVIVLADDLGYSDLGCYGSEIPTPAIDALADRGVRFSNFHATPLCSPTRAALLTGLNSHAVGMGYTANMDPGFPGYSGELPPNQPSMAEMFRANGYATLMVGKWHLAKDSDLHDAGDRHSWPLQRGFDQYYGFLEALTNFHHPHRMYEGNSAVDTDEYPDGYYLTDDLTDRAVQMVRGVKAAAPDKPFFLYYAHGAVHAPLQAKADDIERYRGRYDQGWDAIRERRFARQKELGILEDHVELPPRNHEPGSDVRPWDELTDKEKTVFARYMEVYAAMVQSIDDSVAALAQTLDELGELDNTVFIVTSDNGADKGGRDLGSPTYLAVPPRANSDPASLDKAYERLDEIGGPTLWAHYPRGWGMACNTPFRLYKMTVFNGGHQVPFVMTFPDRFGMDGQRVRHQYTHITDVLPTLVDVLSLEMPTERHGLGADDMVGASFSPTLDDADAPSDHTEQIYECFGHRSLYRDGWEAVTYRKPMKPFRDDHWSLFHVAEDPTQTTDLSDQHPRKVAELVARWNELAREQRIYPLDDGSQIQYMWRPPGPEATAVTFRPGAPSLDRFQSAALIDARSFRITVDWRHHRSDEGIVVAHGGQDSGYVLYVEDGRLHFFENAYAEACALEPVDLPPGSRQVTIDVGVPGGGVWAVSLSVDGTEAATGEFPQLTGSPEYSFSMRGFLPFEGIDVGLDRRSPVSWDLYRRHGCFRFTGDLRSVTYEPGPKAPDAMGPETIEAAREAWLSLQ